MQAARLTSLLIIVCLSTTLGCAQTAPPAPADAKQHVYIDQKTKEIFFSGEALAEMPVNPKTGKPTLSNALYCAKCERWYPVPPFEILQQRPGARFCPKTKTAMTESGPLPAAAKELTGPR